MVTVPRVWTFRVLVVDEGRVSSRDPECGHGSPWTVQDVRLGTVSDPKVLGRDVTSDSGRTGLHHDTPVLLTTVVQKISRSWYPPWGFRSFIFVFLGRGTKVISQVVVETHTKVPRDGWRLFDGLV